LAALNIRSAFGYAEQRCGVMPVLVPEVVRRVRDVAALRGLDGLVLTTPGAVAWATSGSNRPIDRAAPTDTIWVAIGPDTAAVITTNVEAPRLEAELDFDETCSLSSAPWWDADEMVRVAAASIHATADRIGSDGHLAFGSDLSFDLTRARLALTPEQQRSLEDLGRESAYAVESALREWHPGESDHAVAARIAEGVERFGGQCPVLLVGGDDRVLSFRHPVAAGARVSRLVMAVLVASRGGQHVALTRYATARPIEAGLAAGLDATRAIHRDVLAACMPGATIGDAMTILAESYARHGHDGEWRAHYQGGPIGYAQRECEIAPIQEDSPWWSVPLSVGSAVAFNPSISGGAKDEDTYLVTDEGPRWITSTTGWPTTNDPGFPRPAVLDIEN
jgi:antitoxin VapB